MLSKPIKDKIELKFGKPVRYSKDCEVLAQIISDVTKHKISGSTLKRLFGMVDGTQVPRLYTMDVIALYLGHQTYEKLLEEFNNCITSEFNVLKEINHSELACGEILVLLYEPDRELQLEYKNDGVFEVKKSINSKLKENDKLKFTQVVLTYPLFISDVIRNNKSLGQYTAGKISGITSIERIPV